MSPRGDGSLPPEQVAILEGLAGWMGRHGEAITGTEPGLEPWQFYGPSTRRGPVTYLFLLMRPYETVTVRGVRINRVRRAWNVATGRELEYSTRCPVVDRLFGRDPVGEVTISVPGEEVDPLATVLAVEVGG